MENKQQLSKNYNFNLEVQENDYVDAKDTVSHWCVGVIAEVDNEKNAYKVHFEGWTTRYDELIKKNSQKLAPFRRHTEGYTGQKKTAFRDFKINYTQQTFLIKKIQEVILNEFKNFESPYRLTQFLRGELYFQIDSLISIQQHTNVEDLPTIFEFMKESYKMIISWMELFPKYLGSFNECVSNPNLFLVDIDAAISQCGNEFFDIFDKSFGQCQRCLRFLQKFGNEYIYEGKIANKDKIKGNALMLSFLNAFGDMGGFDAILKFIKFESTDSKGKTFKGCPLILIQRVLQPFVDILPFCEKSFQLKFTESVKQALIERLDNLSENEIKELDKEIIKRTIMVLKQYIRVTESPETAYQVAELYELRIAQKYLRCPFFEKRVRGINDLKDIYHKVQNATIKTRNQNDQNIEVMRWLTNDKYAKWIVDERIIEFIFQENPHVELIKRSSEILKLLAYEQLFSPQIIDMLWICATQKHEDIVRSTFDLIQEITPYLPLERVAQLFQKISSIRDSDYDEKTVTFLKNYTISTLKNLRYNKKPEPKQGGSMTNFFNKTAKKEIKQDDSKFYDLMKFWQIFQDSNKISQKVKDQSLNSLVEIISELNEKEIKDQFTILSLENIRRGDTFLSSLIFLRKILNTYPLDSQIKYKQGSSTLGVTSVLHEIAKKNDLFDIILKNTEIYMNNAHYQKPQVKLQPGEKLQQACIVSQIVHEDLIKHVLGFIEFVLMNSKIILTYEHVEKLFMMFVKNPITELETNCFYQLLTKENENAKTIKNRFLLDDKVRNEAFQKIFCNDNLFNFEDLTHYAFQCFRKLFIIVNEEEKTIDVQRDDKIIVNNLNQLQGIEGIWLISIQCRNELVRDTCRDFLVDLYLKAKTKSSSQKKQLTQLFTDKCLSYFKNSQDNTDHQLNCLRIIKTFISRFDGEHILEEDISQYDPKELKIITVTLLPDKANTQIKIHPNQKLWQLKRKMAKHFKMKLSEFYIKTKNGPLDESVYNESIKEYNITQVHIQRISKEEMEKESPKYMIGYNEENLNLFIELLSKSNDVCAREVLNLLECLPFNQQIKTFLKSTIEGFQVHNKLSDWDQMMHWSGSDLSKTVYFLMVLEEMMITKKGYADSELIQAENTSRLEFSQVFLQKNGFAFLNSLYTQLDKKNLDKDALKIKTMSSLLKLMIHIFQIPQFKIIKNQLVQENSDQLMIETLKIIDNFIRACYNQQNETDSKELLLHQLFNDDQVLREAFLFLIKVLGNSNLSINALYNYNGVEEILRMGLIDIKSAEIRQVIQQSICEICMKLNVATNIDVKPSQFFMTLLIENNLQHALKNGENRTKNYFEVIDFIQTHTDILTESQNISNMHSLAKQISKLIQIREIKEFSARDEDVSLSGLFIILKNILERNPEVREKLEGKDNLLKYLIHDCLFDKDTKGELKSNLKAMPPKCKNPVSRENCLKLLKIICFENPQGVAELINYLQNYLNETFWRTQRKSDWSISVHQQERSLTGFVGLKNIGCICYMNSIMQQLYMIPTFRKAILEVEDGSNDAPEDNVLHQIKMIFGGLMEYEKQYYNPKKFCASFKEFDGSPIDPTIQKDVDEFFLMLMDRIENLIKGKKEEKVIKNLVQGTFAKEFICKGCPHYSEREENFLAMSLQVKNKHSIQESLDAFVEGEMLEGDNAYFCEKCEKKVNTLMRYCVKRMPNVLFLVLKRFEFNFDTMSKLKVNDYCEFPNTLDMSNYSQETLAKKDLQKEMEAKNLTFQDLSEEQREILKKQLPSNYYEYKLKGTVIHIGSADSGHYYSFIQDRENTQKKWYEFNDKIVKEFDQNEIPYEAFGGEDESLMNDINSIRQMGGNGNDNQAMIQAMKQYKTKIKNAYVLIYERDDFLNMEKFNEFADDPNINTDKDLIQQKFDICKLAQATSAQIQMQPVIHNQIAQKNKKFWLSKYFFTKTYIEEILNIFKNIKIDINDDYQAARSQDLQKNGQGQFEAFKFFTSFFLTTVVRAKERKSIPHFMKIVREALQKNIALSVWFLETFSNQDIIKEFLIECPIPDMKRFIAGLVKTSMETIYKQEEASIAEYINQLDNNIVEYVQQTQGGNVNQFKVVDMKVPSATKPDISIYSFCSELPIFYLTHHNEKLPITIILINSFMNLCVAPQVMRYSILNEEFYMVFSHFSELGVLARQYLLKVKSLGRFLDILQNGDIFRHQTILQAQLQQQAGQTTQTQQFQQQQQLLQTLQQVSLISDKFRNEFMKKVPLFIITKDMYIESNVKKSEVQISELERKSVYVNHIHPQMFLIYTISMLVRSSIFVKTTQKSPFANDDINYQPDFDEISMINNHAHNVWWDNCNYKVSRNAIAYMNAHISYENKEFSTQYMSTLLNLYQKATFDTVRYYERPLMLLFQIQDSYQTERIKKGVNSLFEIMKMSVQYYKYTDSLIEFIYKCVQRVPQIADYLRQNNQMYRQIEQFTKEFPHFPLNQQRTKIFKQGIVQWNNKPNLVSQSSINLFFLNKIQILAIDRVSAYSKERLAKLWKSIQKDGMISEPGYDSDDDMYKQKFQEKDKIDFCDNNEIWHTGHIEIQLDEMIQCVGEAHHQGNNAPQIVRYWIETESDKIAPPNTITQSEKRKFHVFYVNLHKNIQN